jgi:hypothetical protein
MINTTETKGRMDEIEGGHRKESTVQHAYAR